MRAVRLRADGHLELDHVAGLCGANFAGGDCHSEKTLRESAAHKFESRVALGVMEYELQAASSGF